MEEILKAFGVIAVEEMTSIPAGENPFCHDFYNMGTALGSNMVAMFGNHSNEEMKYLILINIDTGKRVRFVFKKNNAEFMETLLAMRGE